MIMNDQPEPGNIQTLVMQHEKQKFTAGRSTGPLS